jgi:glyoxylase-like metal-dependent hydrolase (beta-lactamase superfamily II)
VKTLAGPELQIPPRLDEIEVSVFGPGFGEAIAVHFGGGQWMIVDSCLSRVTKEPVALDYLEGIGVKLSANVRLVVSTHWHDDHIRGLAKIYEKCESAEFVCAYGLEKDQFATLVSLYSREFPAGGSGLQEFNDVLLTLKKRKQGQRSIGRFERSSHSSECQDRRNAYPFGSGFRARRRPYRWLGGDR